MIQKIITTLFLLCFLSAPSFAQQGREHYPIGQIVKIEGKVWYINTDDQKRTAKIDDPVFLNSRIETDTNSKVLILFIDDTQITLAENSELVIDKYVFDPYDPSENNGEFSIDAGAFHFLSGMLGKSERPNVKIRNPAGTIDIRGTEFWSGYLGDGYGAFVMEGLIGFSGDWGNVEIPAGAGIFLINDAKAPPPEVKPWAKADEEIALHGITFFERGDLDERLKKLHRENVQKRHDYRGRLYPYKPVPENDGYTPDPHEFFSDDFQKMRR